VTPFELALVLGSALLHAWWSVSMKGSGDPLAFNALQSVATTGALLLVLPWVEAAEVPRAVWLLLAASGVVHGLYFYWLSRALEAGELTLVYPIARSTPAFLPFVAVPLLGEELTPLGSAGIAVVVAGLWCVQLGRGLRWSAFTSPAARFAYLTLATTVAYSLVDKGAMAALSAAPWSSPMPRAVLYCLLLSAAGNLLFVPLVLRRLGPGAVRAYARQGLPRASLAAAVSFASYTLILAALETAPASYVVAARQASVLFALILGVAVLGERPGPVRALGAGLTVAGVAVIAAWG
jgi:drug/metabolite transporter (DMT)-like permease